jgi:hypothetical protein
MTKATFAVVVFAQRGLAIEVEDMIAVPCFSVSLLLLFDATFAVVSICTVRPCH